MEFATSSYETALCIVPPQEIRQQVDQLRRFHDKGYGKWPPHINLVYPFVAPESLPAAKRHIEELIDSKQGWSISVGLKKTGFFSHRQTKTVYATDDAHQLKSLRSAILHSLGQDSGSFTPHLTVGQCEARDEDALQYLIDKAALLPAQKWEVGELVLLIRERSLKGGDSANMKVWGTVDLGHGGEKGFSNQSEECHHTYNFQGEEWERYDDTPRSTQAESLSVASYNVLVEGTYPLSSARYASLLRNVLSEAARADILVLQEVSDAFLSYILQNSDIRQTYPFSSHGPPSQPDIGPLPSLRNIVLLSKHVFSWQWISFGMRHKGAVCARFPGILSSGDVVVVGVHISSGLSDSAVLTKEKQINTVFGHLEKSCAGCPWIIAGDFNIITSSFSIQEAQNAAVVSQDSVDRLSSIEEMLTTRATDTWRIKGIPDPGNVDAYDGEEGATFDPSQNSLAAGNAASYLKDRPQRYDRILFGGATWPVEDFQRFGQDANDASDHYGIRASLRLEDVPLSKTKETFTKKAAPSLQLEDLKALLEGQGMLPSKSHINERNQIFELVKDTVNGRDSVVGESARAKNHFIVEAAGSFGLGAWGLSSDIDCLCVGALNPRAFFSLVEQRFRSASRLGVKILRKVQAASGTMIEAEVRSIRIDIQYCQAADVANRWRELSQIPAWDPLFDLPSQTLNKLKSIRDLFYIKGNVSDMKSFQLAYRYIVLWAKSRGIYSSKFGFFGGIHITLMLFVVYRATSNEVQPADLVTTFFNHFSEFDWKNSIVFDPSFHGTRPKYTRTHREPMAILGFHAPNFNVAHTCTVPSLMVMEEELKRANKTISLSWSDPLEKSPSAPHEEFLAKYDSFVKIDLQFWGNSQTKRNKLVGWLESRCLFLVYDIHKRLPFVLPRLWPARFTDDGLSEEFRGCYLMGLRRISQEKTDRKTSQLALQACIDRFLDQTRSDKEYFDASSCWVSGAHVKRDSVKNLAIDTRSWEGDAFDDDLSEEDATENDAGAVARLPSFSTGHSASGGKLRPASDVLHRLRWDPTLSTADYVVGYEDRFAGVREANLEAWKTEATDLEFIPQHRIVYFRHKGDKENNEGQFVWDRRTRTDKLFATG